MDKPKRVYFFFIFLYFLQSLKIWFLWKIPGGIIGIICLFIALYYKNEIRFNKKESNIFVLILGVIAYLFSYDFESVFNAINILVLPINVYVLMMLTDEDKQELLIYIRNGFFYLLIPSLPLFLLYLIGIDLVSLGVQQGPMDFYIVHNHVFFLSSDYGIRFQSYFCEPGHLGMILSFILYSQRFNFKDRKNIYLLICSVFTLSLAAYVLSFIAYIFTYFSSLNRHNIIKNIIIGIVAIVCVFVILREIPIINELIFSRLEYDSINQRMEGDNRISYQTALFFFNLDFYELWNGIGTQRMLDNELMGTGVIIYIIQFGIKGLLFIFLYYVAILLKYWDRRAMLLLLFYCISFYQRSYALWVCQIFLFILTASSYKHETNQLYNYHTQ